MDYTQLVNTIKAYAENDFPDTVGLDSTEQIDTFITNAEIRIYNSVQMPQFKKNVQGLCTAGNQYLSLPLDFKAAYSLAVYTDVAAGLNSDQLFLLDKDVNFMREVYPSPADTGLPQYYALFGTNLASSALPNPLLLSAILGPTPDQNYRVELHYYYYPESITVATSGQTWLGNNFETVLLYGALLDALAFMKSEADVVANYQQRYNEALGQLKRLGDGMDRRDSYRNGQVSNPVT
jgi:hypothetical protein